MKQFASKKKYKALILDLDGTTIPSHVNGLPSKKVGDAIAKASKKLTVSIATSRPFFVSEYLINHLAINAPCIITSGAQIYDPVKKRMLKEVLMTKESVEKIKNIVGEYNMDGLVNEGAEDLKLSAYDYDRPLQIFTDPAEKDVIDEVYKKLSKIPDIHLHQGDSWQRPGWMTIVLGHTKATKQYGVLEVAQILGINTQDIIGVGDGDNDFPLLMACGLKVAMGNAVPGLKEIADYVAPSVEEDGVADVIEKFIL